MPDYKTFKNILKDISREHLVSKNHGKKYVMEALNTTFEPVTPPQLTKYLQTMHGKICEYLKKYNRDLDKVYYVIPAINKSFSLVNYQYQKANDISNIHFYILIKRKTFSKLI